MIIRSALRGILPSHGGARFISSTSTPLSDVYESMRKSLKEEEQSSSKNYEQFAAVRDLADQSTIRARKAQIVLETKERMNQVHKLQDFEKFQSRRWREGDVYSPHDLSHEEMKKWKVPQKARDDVFDVLGINPLHEYKNYSIMWEYMSSMGRIRHRNNTGLRRVNQRRIAKAIRRAVAMGLIPSVHKHPEMLEAEVRARKGTSYGTVARRA